jgi:hypothetical protein
MKALFCIGSSHTTALRDGHCDRARDGKAGGFDRWLQIGIMGPHFKDNEFVVSDALDAEFAANMAAAEVSAVFLCCGGGEHGGLAMFDIWPFEFYMPDDDPRQEIRENCEIIPYDVIAATCAFYVSKAVPFVQRIRSLTSLPTYHILPPPPPAGEGYTREHAGPIFCEQLDKHGISPAQLRHKVWRLCCAAARRTYEGMGIPVIEPPAEALDEKGFLKPLYQRLDMVHGNPAYGALVVDRMARSPRTTRRGGSDERASVSEIAAALLLAGCHRGDATRRC